MAFTNKNTSHIFNMTIPTSITKLSAFDCSEALVSNRTGSSLYIYMESGLYSDDRRFLLEDDESYIFKGITNSDSLSAVAASAGKIYVSTSFYSNTPSR